MDNFKKEDLQPHSPNKLPIDINAILSKDLNIIKLLSEANSSIGTYKGFLMNTPNPLLLISPLITQEAVLSSKLEGTHATLEDWLNHKAGNEVLVEEKDIIEISNYREALFYALKTVDTISNNSEEPTGKLPLTSRVIKEMHKILLTNVRGSTKRLGEFKVHQNYIGSSKNIDFTPVSPEETDNYMRNLEDYIHHEEIDLMTQAAIIHAQFEMIHPFEDGNGRIGRLLIPLFFYYKDFLPTPTFYMSSYFESDRALYLEKLSNISSKGDWFSWIEYFLKGIIHESELNTHKAQNILNLYEEVKLISQELKSTFSIEIIDFIFTTPIFNAKQVDEVCSPSIRTIYSLLDKLVELDVLVTGDEVRNKVFHFKKLLNIVNS